MASFTCQVHMDGSYMGCRERLVLCSPQTMFRARMTVTPFGGSGCSSGVLSRCSSWCDRRGVSRL